jgi:hypothetical protein
MKPLVSVIPTCNVEKYIGKSILGSTENFLKKLKRSKWSDANI